MLSFANVYFFESGLFNGLRPIQIKNFLLSVLCHAQVVFAHLDRRTGDGRLISQRNRESIDFRFLQHPGFKRLGLSFGIRLPSRTVMAGLDPAIHAPTATRRVNFAPSRGAFHSARLGAGALLAEPHSWMAGSSPAMTPSSCRFTTPPNSGLGCRLSLLDSPRILTSHSRNRVFSGAGKIKTITEPQ
jgi:hypothetical protein